MKKFKDTENKLLEQVSDFSKFTQDRMSVKEKIVFIYTNNKQLENEIKNNIYNSIKNAKTLGIKLVKDVHGPYA